jgi:hypothetical protein
MDEGDRTEESMPSFWLSLSQGERAALVNIQDLLARIRGVPAWAHWSAVGLSILVVLAVTRVPLRTRVNPPLPSGYVTLARHLADDCSPVPNSPKPTEDPAQLIAECRIAALEVGRTSSDDLELNALAQEGREALVEGASHLERLAAIPGCPDLVSWFAENFVRGFLMDLVGAFRRHAEVFGNIQAAEAELRSLMATSKRLEVAKLLLPTIAARYSGSPASGNRTIAIDFDAAWGPIGPDDRLALSNHAGTDLHNCTILVLLRGKNGDAVRNVFFVRHWPVGTSLHARCPAGTELLGETVGRRSVPHVESIVSSVWSDELTFESINYAYAGSELDADMGRYCRGMTIDAVYRPFANGLLWNTERGLLVRLRGIEHVPNPRVTATFRRGATELSWYWDFDRWNEGEEKTLDAGGKLPWDPESYSIVVGFPDTSYTNRSDRKPR